MVASRLFRYKSLANQGDQSLTYGSWCSAQQDSIIDVLRRINKDVDNFVAHTQSGFRPSRSTTDVVWSYRWLRLNANAITVRWIS